MRRGVEKDVVQLLGHVAALILYGLVFWLAFDAGIAPTFGLPPLPWYGGIGAVIAVRVMVNVIKH